MRSDGGAKSRLHDGGVDHYLGGLSTREFEHLPQALAREILGANSAEILPGASNRGVHSLMHRTGGGVPVMFCVLPFAVKAAAAKER